MTKDESLIMKGVAILLMLFLHLFNRMDNVELCHTFLSIGDIPLVHILTRAANPVAFFIILSGYGLYISHTRGKYKVWSKLKSLYIHYWISLIIFVSVGFMIVGGNKYPGDIWQFIGNATGWTYSYNGELWFLFPYVLVMLTSGRLIKILDRYNPWLCTGAMLFISMCTGYVISRYGTQYLYNTPLLYKPVLYLQFLCPFTLGVYMAKYNIANKFKILTGGVNNQTNLSKRQLKVS